MARGKTGRSIDRRGNDALGRRCAIRSQGRFRETGCADASDSTPIHILEEYYALEYKVKVE